MRPVDAPFKGRYSVVLSGSRRLLRLGQPFFEDHEPAKSPMSPASEDNLQSEATFL
jgi:hypothetical protein